MSKNQKHHTFILAQLFQPAVYAWRRGEEWLYVGATKEWCRRFYSAASVIGSREPIRPEDTLDVWCVDSKVEAHQLEMQLIEAHKPKHNVNLTGERRMLLQFSDNPPDKFTCLRCRHEWEPKHFRVDPPGKIRMPSVCPNCSSPRWNGPSKYYVKKRVKVPVG